MKALIDIDCEEETCGKCHHIENIENSLLYTCSIFGGILNEDGTRFSQCKEAARLAHSLIHVQVKVTRDLVKEYLND